MIKHFNKLLLPFFLLVSVSVVAQEFGLASYYSDRYQGRRTAYGDTYDKSKLTCSHKKHPYGTLLKVTRLDTKASVVCKVIDKGPYTKGRIVDLSRAAAEKIDLIQDGLAEVKVEVYKPGGERQVAQAAPAKPKPKVTPPPSRASQESKPEPKETTPAKAKPEATVKADKKQKTAKAEASEPVQEYKKYGVYKIQLDQGPKAGYGVQVMVVSDYESVMQALASFQAKHFDDVVVSIEKGQNDQTLFKIIMGPFDTEATAKNYQSDLNKKYKIRGFVVDFGAKATQSAEYNAGN